MTSKSNYTMHGRYGYGGGVVDKGPSLGWWNRVLFPKSTSDITVVITPKYAKRPDLVAYDVYGRSELMWLVVQYNNILDVNTEFLTGVELTLPSKSRVFSELLTSRQQNLTKE